MNDRMAAIDASRKALRAKYREKGISVFPNYGGPTGNVGVMTVKLRLKKSQWLDLFDTDGELLPSCCAAISEIRDTLISIYRNNREAYPDDLERIYFNLVHHGCEESENPVFRYLMNLWETVREDCDAPHGIASDPNDIHAAIGVLGEHCSQLDADRIFDKSREDRGYLDMKQVFHLRAILPAVRTLHEKLAEAAPQPSEGWVVASGDKLLELRTGWAFFSEQERAESFRDYFRDNKPAEGDWTVRPARLSLEKGVEFLD